MRPPLCSNCDADITLEQIKSIRNNTKATDAKLTEILKYLNQYRRAVKIDTCIAKAHFLAQICHESACFNRLKESFDYTSAALLKKFGDYFKTDEDKAKARLWGRSEKKGSPAVSQENQKILPILFMLIDTVMVILILAMVIYIEVRALFK